MARDRLAAMRAAQQGGGGYSQDPAPPSMPSQPQSGGYNQGGYGGGYGQQQPQQAPPPPQQPSYAPQGGRNDGYDAGGRGYAGGYDNKPAYGGGKSYEMQQPNGRGGPQNLDSFMNEMSSLNDGLKSISANVDKIRDLHNRALSQLDESQHAATTAQLQALTGETSRMTNSVKNRIKTLEGQNAKLPPGEDVNVRRNQVGSLKKRFMDVIQKYQQVEQESRQKYKARMERQYKIVKPDATESEIRQAVESNDGGGQVFSQALLNSNRYGDARAAYREVQERHEDIRKIEKTLTELMQMFNDLATMVENDDQMITNIDQNATNVEHDMEQANTQMQKATKSSGGAEETVDLLLDHRRILIAIAIIVALVILNKQGKL